MPTLTWQKCIVADGWHNAFTDLCYWRRMYWLVYRRASNHASGDGGVVVLRSVDLERWQQVGYLNTVGDDRDPKILAVDDRLYVYFGTITDWPDGPVQSYLSTSETGTEWSPPTPVYDAGHWLWRVRRHQGSFYSPAYSFGAGEMFAESRPEPTMDLLHSTDGVRWEVLSRISRPGDRAIEGDLLFRPDGELWCIARGQRNPETSYFYTARPPYREWEAVDLGVKIDSPVFCELADTVFLAGRRAPGAPWIDQDGMLIDDHGQPRHLTPGSTGIFTVERGAVHPCLALPSAGDSAYPGLIPLGEERLLISYYSQHAERSGVQVAHTPHHLPDEIADLPGKSAADIYVADILIAGLAGT